jgi:hypothetical protein
MGSIFVFASDLADEGVEAVLDRVAAAGLDGVTLAATYHEGRDVFPHGRRRVRFHEDGAAFVPLTGLGRLVPPVSELAGIYPELAAAAHERGLALNAWSVFLHNGALAREHPDCAPENAYGDRMLTDLCPAHPDVRAFAGALASNLAALGFATVCAESLHYHPFLHGSGHERSFVPLGARAHFLLGLCFCAHCLAAADGDGERLRAGVRAELDELLHRESDRRRLERPDGDFAAHLEMRRQTVATLVAECAAAAEGSRFEVIEPAGAVLWELGFDPAALAAASDGIQALAYVRDPGKVAAHLAGYGELATSVVLRPMWPDCDGAANLKAKVRAAGDRRVDFYHYGLMPLEALDWIGAALSSSA